MKNEIEKVEQIKTVPVPVVKAKPKKHAPKLVKVYFPSMIMHPTMLGGKRHEIHPDDHGVKSLAVKGSSVIAVMDDGSVVSYVGVPFVSIMR